ncbi:hypothetical protein MBANPS3_004865, partial [Mucor bainieri]
SWSKPAERAMLMRPIVLRSSSTAEALYTYLSRKPNHGKLIKVLYIDNFNAKKLDVYLKLLPLVFTPGIKNFEGEVLCPELFSKMVDLAKSSTSKFKELVSIPYPPSVCLEEYYDTLFYFKDTLQEANICFPHSPPARWDLLDRFDEMKSLVSLTLEGHHFSMKQLESLLNKCSRLQHLEMDVAEGGSVEKLGGLTVQEWCAINVQKNHVMKSLEINGVMRPDLSEFFVYKYPNVDQVKFVIADSLFYVKEPEFDSDDEVYPGDYDEYQEFETCDIEGTIDAFKAYPAYQILYISDLNYYVVEAIHYYLQNAHNTFTTKREAYSNVVTIEVVKSMQ